MRPALSAAAAATADLSAAAIRASVERSRGVATHGLEAQACERRCRPGRVRAGGNVRLVKALAEHVPVLYNTAATSVQYGSEGVCVVTAEGRAIAADAAVVTVPLGVLKAAGLEFSPPLPVAKARAINRLGCDPADRVSAARWRAVTPARCGRGYNPRGSCPAHRVSCRQQPMASVATSSLPCCAPAVWL